MNYFVMIQKNCPTIHFKHIAKIDNSINLKNLPKNKALVRNTN